MWYKLFVFFQTPYENSQSVFSCLIFDIPFSHSQFFSSGLHILLFFLSLEALAPLAGPLPLGVLAVLCLWFTHSVPSGLTGWHKDTKQSWERRARQEAWSYRLIEPYITKRKLSQNRWVVWVKLFEEQFWSCGFCEQGRKCEVGVAELLPWFACVSGGEH